jgi:hypothetical protein
MVNKMLLEIAFKQGYKEGHSAGIKEVVDFIGQPFEHNYFRHGVEETHDINDCFACKFEAKLKEWGIKIEDGK